MAARTFNVPDISCGHCVKTIEHALGELEGVVSVKADADSKTVMGEWNEPPASTESITSLLTKLHYPPEASV